MTFAESILTNSLYSQLKWEIGGVENAILDGEMTHDDLKEFMGEGHLKAMADHIVNEGYKTGHFKNGNVLYESKHIKFLGNARIEAVKNKVINKIIDESKKEGNVL